MKYLGGIGSVIVLLCVTTFFSDVRAISATVVISQVQLGGVGASKQEFIELFNNSSDDIDVADWCLTYSDYKDESQTTLRCFIKPAGIDELRLAGRSYLVVASQTYPIVAGQPARELFSSSSVDMSGARGHVRLLTANKTVLDMVAWDNKATTIPPAHPETLAALAPAAGKTIARTGTPIRNDTDNNFVDFVEQTPALHAGELYEYIAPVPVIDLCQFDGVQAVLPDGYGYDEAGNCELLTSDECVNIDKVQLSIPDGMLADNAKNCLLDVCPNIELLQTVVPAGYSQKNGTCIKIEDRKLLLTELLPNISGSDTGGEFVELYNPFDTPVPLIGYKLLVGKTFEKAYDITDDDGLVIEPKSYMSFTDSGIGFTLLNTTSGVRLLSPSGETASETVYAEPGDDMSWSLLDEVWQYSNQPTPGAANVASLFAEDENETVTVSSALATCPTGKYRHPITNRCRNIEADAAVLASCDADEYRSPDTNRCRKITTLSTSTLAPCEEGYVRNSETNRCRKVLSATTTTTTCASGYERNAETNRCRKVATAANKVAFTKKDDAPAPLNYLAVGSIVVVAAGYGVYEWRREMFSAFGWIVAKAKAAL